ncbi:MAG TPA: RsiV family protein [Blastocatellia bacterium]|nr:RsiV family protein [Blastocatellia bacterium]
MKIEKNLSAAIAALILLFPFNQQTTASANKAISPNNLTIAQTKTPIQAMPEQTRKIFIGSIGGKYDIRMYLWREGNTFSGVYLYESNGGNINLEGTIERDGSFEMNESDNEGNQTAVFKGKLTRKVAGADAVLHLEGTWSKADGSNSMAFSAEEQRFNLGGARVFSKSITTKNKKPAYTIEAKYPLIEGSTSTGAAGFNKEVNSLIASEIADFKKSAADAESPDPATSTESGLTIDYEITFATSDLISVAFTSSPYFAGAAHPNQFTHVLNYDLKAGKPITLGSLFKPGANYLTTIANYCTAQLKKQLGSLSDPDMIKEGASANRDNYRNWNIGRKGIEITFEPYQVAAYAAGPQLVIVRYSALKDLLNPNGPVAALAK